MKILHTFNCQDCKEGLTPACRGRVDKQGVPVVYVCNHSNTDLFSVGQARLKDWVLVLYGTDRNPQQPITSTTTTTTTLPPSTTIKTRQRKHNRPFKPPYYRYDNKWISHSKIDKKDNRKAQKSKPEVKISEKPESKTSRVQFYYFTHKKDGPHIKNEQHMCIFETLAKQNNMSTRQYYQMMKKDLSSGKTMSCGLNHVTVPSMLSDLRYFLLYWPFFSVSTLFNIPSSIL